MTGCKNFINADLIADGLSPLNPSKVQLEAGKLFLGEVRGNVAAREDFAFETTLSGRMYVRLLNEMRSNGWKIVLFYLWVPDAEFSRLRVEQRVESGGHDIPDDAILRRYRRTISNFMNVFTPLCDEVFCYDNSSTEPIPVFSDRCGMREIFDSGRYQDVLESGK